ncbi:hypothetical protein HMPREF9966_0195 [Streptococcus anginosus SK52 = DSM 20563]|nr:hypothetical protein HMPREF9966_0195 [Streptococcus anginosus SK52 = DSM 20563]
MAQESFWLTIGLPQSYCQQELEAKSTTYFLPLHFLLLLSL